MDQKGNKNKHMTYDERLEIQECLAKGMTFKAIGKRIGKHQTTISREVKSRAREHKSGYSKTDAICPKLLKAPFVCNGCDKKSKSSITDIFGDRAFDAIQGQIDKGFDVTDLLSWASRTDGSLLSKFDSEFWNKLQDQFDLGWDIESLLRWAEATGTSMGDIMGMSFEDRFKAYSDWKSEVFRKNYSGEHATADRVNGHTRMAPPQGGGLIYVKDEDVNKYLNMGYTKFATGGYISGGSTGIVAESGPELVQVMNGGVKVTPLSGTARNTAAQAGTVNKIFYNTYNINNPRISGNMDIRRLAEQMANEQRNIEFGRGE